jgi:hypothetical protein
MPYLFCRELFSYGSRERPSCCVADSVVIVKIESVIYGSCLLACALALNYELTRLERAPHMARIPAYFANMDIQIIPLTSGIISDHASATRGSSVQPFPPTLHLARPVASSLGISDDLRGDIPGTLFSSVMYCTSAVHFIAYSGLSTSYSYNTLLPSRSPHM